MNSLADKKGASPPEDAAGKSRIAALEKKVAVLTKKLERCELSRRLLEDTKDRYDLIYRAALNKLDEQHRALDASNSELQRIHQELLEKNAKLQEAATTDSLTHVFNRRRITELLVQEHRRAERYDQVFSLLLIDVDRFKAINDAHGHNVGDRVLRDTARLLKKGVRAAEHVGRWGGEEFLVVLPATGAGDALTLAERLRLSVARHRSALPAWPTCSIGVAQFAAGVGVDEVVRRADVALYEAKKTRNACRAYELAMSAGHPAEPLEQPVLSS